jgi:D-alanine--poly(phosphoribitol) ligase subunit 2
MTGGAAGVQAALAGLLEEQLGLAVPSPDTDLMAAGILDSLALVEMLVAVEERFGVTVDLTVFDIESARTLATMSHWIVAQQAGLSAA